MNCTCTLLRAPVAEQHKMHSRGRRETGGWEGVNVSRQGKLYEAYSKLHRVAQTTRIQINVPVVTVVGYQTDGKSGAYILSRLAWV